MPDTPKDEQDKCPKCGAPCCTCESSADQRDDGIIRSILDRIEEEARLCDTKAERACARSKYSIQDYWVCLEFQMQRLHDTIARDLGLSRRCPHFSFRKRLAEFKQSLRESYSPQRGGSER